MRKSIYSILLFLFACLAQGTLCAQGSVTLSWPFNEGQNNPTSAVVSAEGIFSLSSFSVVSNLNLLAATRRRASSTFSQFQPYDRNPVHNVND